MNDKQILNTIRGGIDMLPELKSAAKDRDRDCYLMYDSENGLYFWDYKPMELFDFNIAVVHPDGKIDVMWGK